MSLKKSSHNHDDVGHETKDKARIAVVGGGLAGCEAAAMIARYGLRVDLFEMKPKKFSPAHKKEALGELVCSNSLGSMVGPSAPNQLKAEMSALHSVILKAAEVAKVPAGRALGVDRDLFAEEVTITILHQDLIHVIREECTTVPDYEIVIIASGPLTSEALSEDLLKYLQTDSLYFYDSISPIVTADSIDYDKVYFGNRYDMDQDDYLNCPMGRALYEKFVEAIVSAEKVPVRSFEALRCFESCLPIEILAERGPQTLAFGPMKPVGLEDPRTGKRPHAVVQLRRENDPTTMYNLVGFQSRMKWGEQKRIFHMIPGLEKAEFVRMGSMHRNTYINSPQLLNTDLSLKVHPHIYFAGQLTGVEGYVESSAMGQWVGLNAVAKLRGGQNLCIPPHETAIGALVHAITNKPLHGTFSPMNMNFGLLPPIDQRREGKEARRLRMIARAQRAAHAWRAHVEETLGRPAVWAPTIDDVRQEMHARSLS